MARHSHVLVGYDGSKEGERALRWAAGEAKLRRLPLEICHAWHWPYPTAQLDPEGLGIVRKMAEHVLDHGVSIVHALAPSVQVRKRLCTGPASAALLHEAYGAEVVVVGSHGHAGLPMGSSALHVPARATIPAIVVRERRHPDGEAAHGGSAHGGSAVSATAGTSGRVVVGVDGSASSDAALEFAFEEAALRDWQLVAVYGAWEPGAVADSELALYADAVALEHEAGSRLERSVAPWRVKYPQVDARTLLRLEPPREALLSAAEGADLLVVGDRGHGGIPPLLLGAVSQASLVHAPCSVAVVHPWRKE